MREFDFYIVGTPIGNLGDMSPRAVETLRKVDFIAAEDTRNTFKLLNHFGIKKPMISYFEHNKRRRGEEIVALIREGKAGALVSDAGMPAISDPGQELVMQLYDEGISITAVPGPSAFTTALVLSGLDTSRFTFEGFLSTTKKNRLDRLKKLKNVVIVVEGQSKALQQPQFWEKLSIFDHVEYYVKTGETKKDAIKHAAADRNVPKSEVYNAVMRKDNQE